MRIFNIILAVCAHAFLPPQVRCNLNILKIQTNEPNLYENNFEHVPQINKNNLGGNYTNVRCSRTPSVPPLFILSAKNIAHLMIE
jgi:hypothetical protein